MPGKWEEWNLHLGHDGTIEVESVDGEPIDLDAVDAVLRGVGVKIRSAAAGHHLLARGVFENAIRSISDAGRMIGIGVDEDEEEV